MQYIILLISLALFSYLNNNIEAMSSAGQEMLRDAVIRVPEFNMPPLLIINKDPKNKNKTYDGLIPIFFDIISSHYNIRFQYIPVIYTVDEGLSQNTIDQFERNEIDWQTIPMVPNVQQLNFVDVSLPFRVSTFTLMQKWPEEKSRLLVLLDPFSTKVWIAFIASTVFLVGVMSYFTIFYQKWSLGEGFFGQRSPADMVHIHRHSEYVLTVITNQGNYIPYSFSWPFFVMVGVWCLTMVVVVNAYTGALTSSLVTPKYEPIVNSLEELADRNMKVAVHKNSLMAETFLNADSGANKVLGDALRQNPKLLTNNLQDGPTQILENDGCALLDVSEVIKFTIGQTYQMNGRCVFTVSNELSHSEILPIWFHKGDPKNPYINQLIQVLWESGILNKFISKFVPNIDQCLLTKIKPQKKPPRFTLNHFSSIFLLLGIGVLISLIAFLLEVFIHFVSSIKKKHSIMVNQRKKGVMIYFIL